MTLNDKLVILNNVLGDLVIVQAVVLPLTGCIDDAFRDIHALSAVVLQLVTVYHDGERLTCLHERGLKVDGESLLTQQSDTHMSCGAGTCVDGRHNSMTCQRCFHSRVALHISHLADTDDVGVET